MCSHGADLVLPAEGVDDVFVFVGLRRLVHGRCNVRCAMLAVTVGYLLAAPCTQLVQLSDQNAADVIPPLRKKWWREASRVLCR